VPPAALSDWPPRWLTPVPDEAITAGDGEDVADFIEALCKVTMDSIAAPYGTPLELRNFQRRLIERLFARDPDTGLKRHRVALVGMARKNGKSALLAAIALFELFYGQKGGQIYVVAGTRDQARIIFETAKQMIRMEPELAEIAEIKRDAIYAPETNSTFQVMSSDAPSLEGLNPTLVAFDEVHVQPDRALWDVFSLAQGARRDAQLIGITTAGVRTDRSGHDSLCYSLYGYGRRVALGEVADPSFFMAWWEPENPKADHRLPDTWREGNPGFGDIVGEADFHAQVVKTPEPEFRTKRCNQWVSSATAWLPYGTWAQCGDGIAIPDGADVVLGFDGSYNGDCTALVAVSVGEDIPRVCPVRVWEPPEDAAEGWSVPILEVEHEIRNAALRWHVLEVAADPFRWSRSLELLGDEGLPVEPFPQSASRMVPATTRFYEAVVNRELVHDRNPILSRHLDNAAIKVDERGSRLTKGTRRRRIDAAVAAVMAFDRAAWWTANRPEEANPEVYFL
jgi:phage terminase large subunit-like protein